MAEPLKGTFFAFRKREHGGVLLKASVAYVLALILLCVAMGGLAWLALGGMDFFSWYAGVLQAAAEGSTAQMPPPSNPAGLLLLIPLYFVFLFAMFVLLASYEAACVRWMVRGERSAFGLHFGADMWRVYGTYWVFLLFAIVGWIVFFIVSMIAGAIAANAGDFGGWIVFAVMLAAFLACIYVCVRLSSASATSIAIGRFDPLKAWSASRGRFWAIFGAYVLLAILYLVAYLIVASVALGAFWTQIVSQLDWTLAQSDPQAFMRAYEQASMQAMADMFASPASIALYFGGQALIYAVVLVFYVLWFGVESRVAQAALEEGKIQAAS